jgi:hypothetical protein
MSKSFVLLLFGVYCLHAQNTLRFNSEIGGSVFYSYSNTVSTHSSGDPVHHSIHQLQLEPEFGWFVLQKIQLLVDVDYALTYSKWDVIQGLSNDLNDQRYSLFTGRSQTHRVGLFIGCSYNINLNKEILLFFGPKIGLSTTRSTVRYDQPFPFNFAMDTGWQPVELSFPSFFCGTKCFFNPCWALVLRVQYTKTERYQGYSNESNDAVVFGLGITRML